MKKAAMLDTAGRRFVALAGVHATRTGRQRRLADEHATDKADIATRQCASLNSRRVSRTTGRPLNTSRRTTARWSVAVSISVALVLGLLITSVADVTPATPTATSCVTAPSALVPCRRDPRLRRA